VTEYREEDNPGIYNREMGELALVPTIPLVVMGLSSLKAFTSSTQRFMASYPPVVPARLLSFTSRMRTVIIRTSDKGTR